MSRFIKLGLIVLLLPTLLGVTLAYSLVNYLEIPDVKQLSTQGDRKSVV
jgi:hypothetical protein